ncbi:HNH endonuclease [Acinetobacter faecalis]|uniref:HNH endonuclease signature motif containing protein n=1 Tax=Acinetobacter faecalis TaxID=2665161 RepID=A0ABU5GLU3_9GAMM|nr:HNH endonuclease signature motif containing protein [Acinetobacter faecalis]MDY6530203.1 HNH endonuclease signature motif containing protein [Acinetobacter faecalis]MDY6551427.1 HNH endonuclease signature motif containing protein [Acinetobacter faecalis]
MSNAWKIPKEIERLVLERDKSCVYCGCEFSTIERAKKKSWEHIINDIRITTLDNIALCCIGCNASKGSKDLVTWFYSDNAIKRGVSINTISDIVKSQLTK